MADMEEDSDEVQEWGQSPPIPRVIPPSPSCRQSQQDNKLSDPAHQEDV